MSNTEGSYHRISVTAAKHRPMDHHDCNAVIVLFMDVYTNHAQCLSPVWLDHPSVQFPLSNHLVSLTVRVIMPKRVQSDLRPNATPAWMLTFSSLTEEALQDIWRFNSLDGGPVPDRYPLGGIIIGFENPFPSTNPTKAVCYFELGAKSRVRVGSVMRWFPRAHVSPRHSTAEKCYQCCRREHCCLERGRWSWERKGAAAKVCD